MEADMFQSYFSKNRNFSIFVFSLAALHLSYADEYAQDRSIISYCNQVIDDTGFVLVPGDTANNNDEPLEGQLNEFAYEHKMSHISCKISHDRGLLIQFECVTKVSGILIDETAFGPNLQDAIKVSLRRGASTFECKSSPGDIIELSNGMFSNFSCNDAYQSSGTLASNEIEITSINSEVTVNLANLKAEGSFGWLFIVQQGSGDSSYSEADSCPIPGLYSGQTLRPEKQVYQLGEVVTFSCPGDSVLESPNDAKRVCQTNGKWSDDTPKCLPQRQWYESIVSFNQEFTPSTSKENVSMAAHFNRDFYSINEIAIDFAEEFNSSEWKRWIADDRNAIFYISDSSNNIFRRGALPPREPTNKKWDSITVSAENFIRSRCMNCTVGVTFRSYYWQVPIVRAIRIFGSTISQDVDANKNGETQCPPITPYGGMPNEYESYRLVAEGSINNLLLTSPCREGFKFVGKRSEINQCKDGAWHGSGFPNCEAIRVKAPPEVEHASWVYVHNDVHETIYICENGYHAIGKGNRAIYSIEDDEWTNVPQCEQLPLHSAMSWTTAVVLVVVFIAFLAVVVCLIYKSRWKWNSSDKSERAISNVTYSQPMPCPDEECVQPSSTLLHRPSNAEDPPRDLAERADGYQEV